MKNYIIATLAIIVVFLLIRQLGISKSESSLELFIAGQIAFKSGDFDTAERNLKTLLSRKLKNQERETILISLAQTYSKKGNIPEEAKYLNTYLSEFPNGIDKTRVQNLLSALQKDHKLGLQNQPSFLSSISSYKVLRSDVFENEPDSRIFTIQITPNKSTIPDPNELELIAKKVIEGATNNVGITKNMASFYVPGQPLGSMYATVRYSTNSGYKTTVDINTLKAQKYGLLASFFDIYKLDQSLKRGYITLNDAKNLLILDSSFRAAVSSTSDEYVFYRFSDSGVDEPVYFALVREPNEFYGTGAPLKHHEFKLIGVGNFANALGVNSDLLILKALQ